MTLEAVVFQEEQYSYGWKDSQAIGGGGGGGGGSWSHGFDFGEEDHQEESNVVGQQGFNMSLDSSPSSMVQSVNDFDTNNGSAFNHVFPSIEALAATTGRKKRKRIRSIKNKEVMETQRMTHIAVERNRRKQMNVYLAALRSMMPAPYAQRGDQASIIGGAINFVKELEQLLQSIEGQRRTKQQSDHHLNFASIFSSFFDFPQYSTCSTNHGHGLHNNSSIELSNELTAEKRSSAIADVEVSIAESHANIKVLVKKQPRQLLNMVLGLHSLRLMILHLNVTTVDSMILYSFSVKIEDNSQQTSVNEIAADVYEMVGRIQEEAQHLAQ